MENVFSFRKVEVSGSTKKEALEKAPFYIQGDATPSYKKMLAELKEPLTDKIINEFCINYLKKNSKCAPGSGFSITKQSAVVSTRNRPFKFTNVKNEKGKRKYVLTYQLIDKATGNVLAETNETKAKAKELAKKLYTENGFKGDIICTYTKQVTEGEPVAFECKYTPSKNSHSGLYLCFGIEA